MSPDLLDLLSDERGRGDGVFEVGAAAAAVDGGNIVGVVGIGIGGLLMSPFMSSPAIFKFWS